MYHLALMNSLTSIPGAIMTSPAQDTLFVKTEARWTLGILVVRALT